MAAENKPNTTKINDETIAIQALNNLDTPNQILQYLEGKQMTVKLYKFLSILVRQKFSPLQKYLTDYLVPGHTLNMFSNDWDGSLPSGYFEEFSHRSLLPCMISPVVRNTDRKDPITQLIIDKQNWAQHWYNEKQVFDGMKLKKHHKWLANEVLFCPQYYVDMAKTLQDSPDEYFDSAHNWYYTGKGNLQLVNLDGFDYMIHSEFNCLYVTPFYKDNTVDYNHSVTYQCKPDLKILETIHSNYIIVLRTKFKVIILKIEPADDSFELTKIKDIDSKWAYTSVTFDEHHKNILYLTTIENQLTIVNLDRMKGRSVKLRGKLNTLVNNWNTVMSAQRECYVHVNRQTITFYDKRTNTAYERWKSLRYLTDVESCNKITAATFCMGRPQLYVASTHHLFLLDMRCDRLSKLKPQAIQRWTHGMRVPPSYFSICENTEERKDMICFTSQWPEDMALITNYSDVLERRLHLNSAVVPYRPPSIIETFKEAQRNNLCCDIIDNTGDRLVTSISGLAMYKQDNNYVVLMQNSLGDISKHFLYPRHRILNVLDDSMVRLHEWSKDIKFNRPTLECSHIFDVSRVWKELREIPDSVIIGRKDYKPARHKFNEQEIYDIFEKGEVDPQFLEIWKNSMNETKEEIHDHTQDVTGISLNDYTLNYTKEEPELPDEF